MGRLTARVRAGRLCQWVATARVAGHRGAGQKVDIQAEALT
jgi:hypothetical protein